MEAAIVECQVLLFRNYNYELIALATLPLNCDNAPNNISPPTCSFVAIRY